MGFRLLEVELLCQVRSRFAVRSARAPQGRGYSYAACFAGCLCFLRDFAVVFFFSPVCSKLFCNTETRSITFVGFGAFRGFSSISLPPASTFSSITSRSEERRVGKECRS